MQALRALPQTPPSEESEPLEIPHGDEGFEQERVQWISVTDAPTLAQALSAFDTIVTAARSISPDGASPAAPPWVLLTLLSRPPATQMEAFVVHSLVISTTSRIPQEMAPLFTVLDIYWLLHFRMYSPVRAALTRFLRLAHTHHPDHLTLVIRIISQADPAPELQSTLRALLDVAIRERIPLDADVYRRILQSPLTEGSVVDLIRRHMTATSYRPNFAHTRAMVTRYAESGRPTPAANAFRHIREADYYGAPARKGSQSRYQARILDDVLRAHNDPLSLNHYVRYLMKANHRASDSSQSSPTTKPPPLDLQRDIPVSIWLQGVRSAAEDLRTPASRLLETYRTGREHIANPSSVQWADFAVIKGLLRRRMYEDAAQILRTALKRKAEFSTKQVTIAVETLTMINRPDLAFRLLLGSSAPNESTPPPGNAQEHTLPPSAPRSKLDVQAVNSFMNCLLAIGRPDAVFFLWDTMPRVLGLAPNTVTFGILLKAARVARLHEGAIQVALADFGLGRILRRAAPSVDDERAPQRLSREDAVAGLERMLAPGAKHVVTGFWRGERAGVVALRVAWQVLVGNWPLLASLVPPVYPLRRAAGGEASAPIADLFHSFTAGARAHSRVESATAEAGAKIIRPHDEDGRTYFGVVPEDAQFLALIDLLAAEDRVGQIPLVLSWMRFAMVRPSAATLACALVYWGEVTLEGLWVQPLRRMEHDQYIRLREWIRRWVGRGNMPTREARQNALMRVRRLRDAKVPKPPRVKAAETDWEDI